METRKANKMTMYKESNRFSPPNTAAERLGSVGFKMSKKFDSTYAVEDTAVVESGESEVAPTCTKPTIVVSYKTGNSNTTIMTDCRIIEYSKNVYISSKHLDKPIKLSPQVLDGLKIYVLFKPITVTTNLSGKILQVFDTYIMVGTKLICNGRFKQAEVRGAVNTLVSGKLPMLATKGTLDILKSLKVELTELETGLKLRKRLNANSVMIKEYPVQMYLCDSGSPEDIIIQLNYTESKEVNLGIGGTITFDPHVMSIRDYTMTRERYCEKPGSAVVNETIDAISFSYGKRENTTVVFMSKHMLNDVLNVVRTGDAAGLILEQQQIKLLYWFAIK